MASHVLRMQYPHGVLRERLVMIGQTDFQTPPRNVSGQCFNRSTNGQLRSKMLISLIAGVAKGLPARLLLTVLVNLK
jgi:hypothetical protein